MRSFGVLFLLATAANAFILSYRGVRCETRRAAVKEESAALNKGALVDHLVEKSPGLTKAQATKYVTTLFDIIADSLAEGKKVTLQGFGSFSTSVRAAREARNPRTGEPVSIPETVVASFTPAKALKDKVNGRTE